MERALRTDAAANRNRVLAAAAIAVRRDGEAVPLATIAAEAGVGIATLYRSYPSREALLGALTERSFRIVLDAAQRAESTGSTAIESLELFLYQTIDHGPELVLPLHGGPVQLDPRATTLRAEVHAALARILKQGQVEGTVSPSITAFDIVIFGALLARPLPHVRDWSAPPGASCRPFSPGSPPPPDPRRVA